MPARDEDKAMDGLLRRSLARDAAAPGDCPDADILAAYYERSLDADEAAGYEQHFAKCTRCREHLAALLRAETAVEVSAGQPVTAAAASTPRARAASPASSSAAEKPGHSWVFGWRWLAPAAAVLIFAVFVYTRMAPRESKTFLSKNEAAVSKPEAVLPPAPSQDLSARAESLQPQRAAEPKPPAPQKGKAAPTPPAEASPPSPPPPPPRQPSSAGTAQAGAGVAAGTRTSSSASSGLVGGAMARSRGTAGGVPAQKQPPDAAAPAREESTDSGRPAAAPSARAVVHAAPAPSTPPPTEAKNEAPPLDSSAQQSRVYPAEKKSETPAAAAGSAGGETNSTADSLRVTGSTASVAIMDKIGPLYRITSDGAVERSNDGGATWQPERLKTNSAIVALSAPWGKICWLVGRGGTILLTKNGKSWKKISPPAEIDLVGVTAQDARSATVTAIDGRQFSTEDAGKNWEQSK
jgi:photosynthesis system II assembly factor YCF48-like protein